MREAVIVSAVRTAVGRAKRGTLRFTRPEELGAAVVAEALRRAAPLKGEEVEDLIMGCAMPEGSQGLNVARYIGLKAGLPDSVPAQTVNRFCSSGLQTIAQAAAAIKIGEADAIIAGGVEVMSLVPMGGFNPTMEPGLAEARPESYIGMGHTAERVAARFTVSRQEMDEYAAASHAKALAAIAKGVFKDEIVPVKARQFKDGAVVYETFDTDECPRETTVEGLAKLKPAFKKDGIVTAGNSSPTNDGAAAVVVLAADKAKALKLKPLAYFRHFTAVGVPPDIMGIGPKPAIEKLLAKTGLAVKDIDLFEINEAFAAQAYYVARELKLPAERVNVNGGAIALGHPLGATGAKLATQLVYELNRRKGRYGIVSMCIGGGMGAAGLFERVG